MFVFCLFSLFLSPSSLLCCFCCFSFIVRCRVSFSHFDSFYFVSFYFSSIFPCELPFWVVPLPLPVSVSLPLPCHTLLPCLQKAKVWNVFEILIASAERPQQQSTYTHTLTADNPQQTLCNAVQRWLQQQQEQQQQLTQSSNT